MTRKPKAAKAPSLDDAKALADELVRVLDSLHAAAKERQRKSDLSIALTHALQLRSFVAREGEYNLSQQRAVLAQTLE